MNASTNDQPARPVINPEGFRSSPDGHVYGIVDRPNADVAAVTADLLAADVELDAIHVYCCDEGADRLDAAGTAHGLRARVIRMVQSVGYSSDHLERIERELRAGHALIGVAIEDDRKDEVGDILQRHGGHDIVHYGKYTWQRLGGASRTSDDAGTV